MREDGLHQFRFGCLERLTDGVSLDQFGNFCADHMRAEQFAGSRIKDRFDHAFCFAKRNRFAIADEGEVSDLDL